jgi:hypothetical protein
MNSPTSQEIANDFNLWQQYVDPSGIDTKDDFENMDEAEKLEIIQQCFN